MSYTAQFAIAGRELSLSSCCIASLDIHNFSTAVDFLSEKYRGSTGHKNLGTSRETYSEDSNGETGTCNPLVTNRVH